MLTLINAEFGPSSALRRYYHPELGVLLVITKFGRSGSADIVDLSGAIWLARGLKAFAERERPTPVRAPRKRQPRQRSRRQRDPKSAA
jgi:hypothetical protein